LNLLKTGGQEVELKSDSEYPEWLWKLSLAKGPTLEEMEPNTLQWWCRKRRLALRYKNKQMRNQFPQPFLPNSYKKLRLL
jgi:large subunit ribosomal protein L54